MADQEHTNGQAVQVQPPQPIPQEAWAKLCDDLKAAYPGAVDTDNNPDVQALVQAKLQAASAVEASKANTQAARDRASKLPPEFSDMATPFINQALAGEKQAWDALTAADEKLANKVQELKAGVMMRLDDILANRMPLAIASFGAGRSLAYHRGKGTSRASNESSGNGHQGGRASEVIIKGYDIAKIRNHGVQVQGQPISEQQLANLVDKPPQKATDLCKAMGISYGRGYNGQSQANREAWKRLQDMGFQVEVVKAD